MTGVVVCCPVQPTGDEQKGDWMVPSVKASLPVAHYSLVVLDSKVWTVFTVQFDSVL